MRLLIGFALLGLAALAGALLTAGAGAQQRSLALEERTPSSLTVAWSWDELPPAAFELAWRARGDDESTAWRTVRKEAADRRHIIENLDAGLHYVVRLRGLDAADRPIHDLRGIFATAWSAPRLLRLIASRDGALTVGWSQPSDWNPHGWRLSWRVAGSQTPGGAVDLPAAARSRRIDGLSTATDYIIRLSALNARGGESPAQTIRATASAAALETPRLTALSWSGLTIRAEWQPVPRADGYDLFWRAAEERGGAVGRLTLTGTSAEFNVPAGAYWVELRARVGEGRAARRSDRTQPRNITLLPAPHYLRVQSFDGEQARLTWPGADIPEYDLEWGRGGTKQTETRDGRSGLIEVGPLEGGNTYEFRVRARNDLGRSGWSPTAALSPTIWPQLRPLAALDTDGSLYALWPPAAGAEWYEAQWLNAADPAETARVRVSAAPAEGGGIAARIPRDGGFEDGRWLVRVRAGPWGTWSIPHALDLAGQPPRLSLALESSRELCTAGTLTEISWQISGGSAPYALSVENSAVDVSADNIRLNCGALTDIEAADEEAALAAKTVTAVVTDSRGVRRKAALEVARARALSAPANVGYWSSISGVVLRWNRVAGAGSQSPLTTHPVSKNKLQVSALVRTRANSDGAAWSYHTVEQAGHSELFVKPPPHLRVFSVAVVRHPLELETTGALNWSKEIVYAATKPAQNVSVTATHDTVTVSWDRQPYAVLQQVLVWLFNDTPGAESWQYEHVSEEPGAVGRHTVTFANLSPDTRLRVMIAMGEESASRHYVRTRPAPPDWTPPPAGPQNLRYEQDAGTLTILWDNPYAGAQQFWLLTIENPATGASWLADVYGTSWTLPAWLGVFPNTQYRVTVEHLSGMPPGSNSILITTPGPPTGQQTEVPDVSPRELWLRTFFPIWPVLIDERYTMTDDPFQFRVGLVHDSTPGRDPEKEPPDRYHGGLDIGEYSRVARTPAALYGHVIGDGVYAATDGILRVFADGLERTSVVHCPTATALHQQFYVAPDGVSTIWSEDIPDEYKDHSTGQGGLPDGIYCQGVAGWSSGRVAILSYTRSDGLRIATKYGHLAPDGFPEDIARALKLTSRECESMNLTTTECTQLSPNKSVRVRQGQRIATIGNSGRGNDDDGFDLHVHFEILHLNVPTSRRTAPRGTLYGPHRPNKRCGVEHPHRNSHDCTWNGVEPRYLGPVLDVEAYLPPLPASPVPTYARDAALVQTSKHVVQVEKAEIQSTGSTTTLAVSVSIALWRPSFYAQYFSDPGNEKPWLRGQISRTGRAGIASTGPGVDSYHTNVPCSVAPGDEPDDPNLPDLPDRPDLPTVDVRSDAPNLKGDPEGEGELPREMRSLRLTRSTSCRTSTVTVRASNAHWERRYPDTILDRANQNIALRDPSARLTWVAELSAGTNVVRSGESLVGDDLDLYTFTARRGNVYKFCTIPSGTSACAPEAAGNVAELLIIGPDGEVKSGITRDDSGLEWEVPDNGPANDDYVLVVRRRARWEGSGDPHAYTLKYTAPPIGVCDTLRLTLGAFLFVCTPPKPADLSTASTDDTITATVTPPAGALEIEFKRLPAGANCTTTTGPTVTVAVSSSDAASGATGAADKVVSPPFGDLTPATTYKLCARAVRTIETGFTLHSDWTSTEATTAAAPPPDTPDPPACTPDNSIKPSTTQTVTSTKTRWTMSGVYEFKEQRTQSQRQTRSVSWECATSTWTSGAWGDSGDPTYGSWSATGDERCTDPYAAKPAEARTEPATEYRWVLRGATAHQQKRTGTAHYSRTVTKTGPRACGWTLGEWGSPDRTSWGTWADTGTSEERPVDSETEDRGNGTATRWDVGSSSACEEIEQLQRRRTRSVRFSVSNGWTTGSWSVWGDPYRAGWVRTGTCVAKPADKTVTVTERQTRLGPPVFAGTSFCVQYPEKRSRSAYYYQPYVWDASATAWTLGERAERPYSYSAWTPWTRTGERPQPCAFSALPNGSWSLASGDYELEWSAQRVLFTVPDDASVELSWRARDGGGQEAVFSVAGEGELTVHPDSLDASSGAASGESSERPTLDAIENSLTLVEASAD